VVLIILAVVIYRSGLPEVDTDQEDENTAQSNSGKTSIMQFPHLLLGVLTLFFYVGVEVIAGDTIINMATARLSRWKPPNSSPVARWPACW
jgi:FHS family L-fucose permease-like MFS transporter